MVRLARVLPTLFILFVYQAALGQSSDSSGKIRLYFSCENCDFDFVRNELSLVDHVRDPAQADVHCYVVRETAGNGGSRYTFTFLGHGPFENVNDTLRFLVKESSTAEEFRTETVHTLSLGLTRYVAHSPQASQLSLNYKTIDQNAAPIIDPWDSWVFSVDLNGYLFVEQQHGYYNYYGSASANRTTPEWKIRTNLSGGYTENRFTDLGVKSISRSGSFDALVVKSLSDHWSTGPSLSVGTSTYRNRKLSVDVSLGLEYDLFPYSESTSRQLRVLYKIGADKFNYFDTTIYNKTQELVGSHVLSTSLILTQPWGSAELTVAGSQYLNDLSLTELNIYTNLQLRLFEGLSLRLTGNYASIHDQIFLPRTGLTSDDILLQLQQLKTDYSYYASVGLTYTFGSIYNNIVNPRFGN
jgi:hypothetical protein